MPYLFPSLKKGYIQCTETLFFIGSYPSGNYSTMGVRLRFWCWTRFSMLKTIPELAWTTVNFYSSWESVSPTSGIKLNTKITSWCPINCAHLVWFCQVLQIDSTVFHCQGYGACRYAFGVNSIQADEKSAVPVSYLYPSLKGGYIQCTEILFLIGSYPSGNYFPWWDHHFSDLLWCPNLILFLFISRPEKSFMI